jgi:hypothetical protein
LKERLKGLKEILNFKKSFFLNPSNFSCMADMAQDMEKRKNFHDMFLDRLT